MTRRHLSPTMAHATVTELLAKGHVQVIVPKVEDLQLLLRELEACGVEARHYGPPAIDAKAVRQKTGLPLDEFALRYGLDAETMRQWEEGIIRPDTTARTLLWTIALHPEAIEATLQENADLEASTSFGP